MIVFIDCGAHCGESILRAKNQFGINTRIISFEPIPYFAEEIRKIWENDESVDVINAAVWVEDGISEFQLSSTITDGSSLLKISPEEYKDEYLIIKVNTFDFSNFLKQFKEKDFKLIVKFDIEGAEYQVLSKMIEEGTINYIDEFWGEWHEVKTDEQKKYQKEVFNYLEENNIVVGEWEEYIPTVGKAHPQLAERPHRLKDII
jgi:FkbM family methyltransferase